MIGTAVQSGLLRMPRYDVRRLADLGLTVNISEMDVRIRDAPGTAQTRLELQKSVYKSMVGVCVEEPRCDAVTFWGFTDAHSWIDSRFGADDPLHLQLVPWCLRGARQRKTLIEPERRWGRLL
jgi:GH35 family endo-1,4-beta-xylanase